MYAIVQLPNPILTTPAKEVKTFDKKLMNMVSAMKTLLTSATNPKGVGLAGPQAGFPYRIFLIKPGDSRSIRVFINPKIIHTSDAMTQDDSKKDQALEGCLSIPAVWGSVNRHQEITLAYQDETGAKHQETFSGFPATIIQHETDHINGILFTHRVIEQKGKFFQVAKDEKGKEVLEELELK